MKNGKKIGFVAAALIAAMTVFAPLASASKTAGDASQSTTTVIAPLQISDASGEQQATKAGEGQSIAKRRVCCTRCTSCRNR